MNAKYILEMRGITKRFPGVVALNDVSIGLEHGKILSICGENGAGKSTLMKVLAGDYEHGSYDGEIYIDDKLQRFTSTGVAERAGIAMIYQEINVELDLSVAENIMLGIMPKNAIGLIDWKKTKEIAATTLEKLKVTLDVDTTMRNLSASVQQLVCIARALVRNPKILILDEPTSALTETETEALMLILADLKQSGISCIYISHKLDEVFKISDRIIVMRDSNVVSSYLREDIKPDSIIEDMIGRRMDSMYPSMSGRIMGNRVLEVKNFQVMHPSSKEKNIIENVSFYVRKGEVLGLGGLVGSGRSELLRAVFGALPKTSGEVLVDGKHVSITSPKEGIKCGLGLLTEERKKDGVISTMNIGENMTLSILKKISQHTIINKKNEQVRIDDYFESLKIKAPSQKTNIMSLSGGNQQKVILAKSLLTDMKVLFLDEPTRGIDIGAKSEIYKIIETLANKGLSIVMISSEYPELLAMCDRFVVIGNGRVVGELTKEEASEVKLIKMASMV
ncbi:sugar ABC transporter ATP-binding protein [Oscillospiraceae bacterium PP1C4]